MAKGGKGEPIINAFLTDDHPALREGLKSVFERQGIHIIGEANSADETLRKIFKVDDLDVLVVDLTMEGTSGLELIKKIYTRDPTIKIIVYSMREDIEVISEAYSAGAIGYVTKNCPPKTLVSAVKKVAKGGKYFMPGISDKIAEHKPEGRNPTETLTPRQMALFIEIAKGKSYADAGETLNIGANSVRNQIVTIRKQLNVAKNADLTKLAVRYGLIKM